MSTFNTRPLSTILFIRLYVLEILWHYLQSNAFVIVYSVGLDMALFLRDKTAAI